MTIGDRQHPSRAQDNSNHAGTIVRLTDSGAVPPDNPFVESKEDGKPEPRPEIWSYGLRDPMGFQVHPETGELWLHEHGPRGGDELNRVKKGGNYGWCCGEEKWLQRNAWRSDFQAGFDPSLWTERALSILAATADTSGD